MDARLPGRARSSEDSAIAIRTAGPYATAVRACSASSFTARHEYDGDDENREHDTYRAQEGSHGIPRDSNRRARSNTAHSG